MNERLWVRKQLPPELAGLACSESSKSIKICKKRKKENYLILNMSVLFSDEENLFPVAGARAVALLLEGGRRQQEG